MNSNIKKSIYITMTLIFFVLVIFLFISGKTTSSEKSSKEEKIETFSFEDIEETKLKGKSVISNSQSIIVDLSKGEVSKVEVKDGDIVKAGDFLFSYVNKSVLEEIYTVNMRIEKIEKEIKESESNLQKINDEISSYETELKSLQNLLDKEATTVEENLVSEDSKGEDKNTITVSSDISTDYEEKKIRLNEKKALAESKLESEKISIESNLEAKEELGITKRSLQKQTETNIHSSIDGRIYINEIGKIDPSVEFIRIVNLSPLVEGIVSEYDYSKLNIGDKVNLTVLVNGENVDGTITKVTDLPSVENSQLSEFKFYVKPSKPIQFGYNVEITLEKEVLKIPKSLVREINGEYYVWIVVGNSSKKTKVELQEHGDYFLVLNNSIKSNQKLILNPDISEEIE